MCAVSSFVSFWPAAVRDRAGGIDDRARLEQAESNPSELGRIG
jgi:hypothetical protein